MATGYVHIEVETAQSPKHVGAPCGDVVACDRTMAATTLVAADGIGSGVRARVAAEMCKARLLELLRLGFSLRKAVARIVETMQQNRDPSRPYAAFTVARILNDGMATVLSYEAPATILISRRHAAALPQRSVEMGGGLVAQSECYLEPGDALLVMSDGITQAGLGRGHAEGWATEGVVRYVNHCLTGGRPPREIPAEIHREARRLWMSDGDNVPRLGVGRRRSRGMAVQAAGPMGLSESVPASGDDCTAVMALCRRGQIVNLLTGPPADRSRDAAVVNRLIQAEGLKIVCGGTTAEMVARVLGERLEVEQDPQSVVAPPRYEIAGVGLVTEGAVTLNQVYNILDEDIAELTEDSGVTELCALLQVADRVNIFLGGARNRAAGDISFRQQGILTRQQIVPLLAEKLRAAGKLVVVEKV